MDSPPDLHSAPAVGDGLPPDPVEVTAAAIIRGGLVLAARRPPGKARGGLWELPGGKVELGETLAQCLARELREELTIEVEVGPHLITVSHAYPDLRLNLHVFRCAWRAGTLRPQEGQRLAWLAAADLDSVTWCPADAPVVERLRLELAPGK